MVTCSICKFDVYSYIRDEGKMYCIPCHDEKEDRKKEAQKHGKLIDSDFGDANYYTLTGVYTGSNMLNVPTKSKIILPVIRYNSKVHQETYLPDGTRIERYLYKGKWSPWRNDNGEIVGQYKE